MTLGILGALSIGQYAAAIIVFFMRFADFLEGFTTERSRQALKEILNLAPETARVEWDGREVEVPAEEVRRGEVVLVMSWERIPVDGRVLEGHGSVNQAPITGESIPVEKATGDAVFAATICERRAFATIKQNLWFTAADNVLGLLLAALGWQPPIAAAAAHSLPDVAVMLTSSRLLRRR